MSLETEKTEKGIKICVKTRNKIAVLIEDGNKERILLPLNKKAEQNTYYYENPSGLTKTQEGYIGFYPGIPDKIKLLN